MSVYISLNTRKEIKDRIKNIDMIKENLRDAEAEFEEVLKRDAITKTKGSGDVKFHGNTGSEKTHPGISLPNREEVLKNRIAQYSAMIRDYDRGWNLLSDLQKECLTERFKKGRKQINVARSLGYDERQLRRIENEALSIMEKEMLKV